MIVFAVLILNNYVYHTCLASSCTDSYKEAYIFLMSNVIAACQIKSFVSVPYRGNISNDSIMIMTFETICIIDYRELVCLVILV